MKKPLLVDGWNPFDAEARYGLPATLLLLLTSYIAVAHFLEKSPDQRTMHP